MITGSLKDIANLKLKNFREATVILSDVESLFDGGTGCTIKELKDIIEDTTGTKLARYEDDEDYYFYTATQLESALTTASRKDTEGDGKWHLFNKKEDD